ncbi:MAG: hypothetical protein Kow00121_53920 [Elainellaceae cyanobacterium]
MAFWVEKRILCVDNTEDDRELFKLFLTEAGYTVESAHSFSDAMQRIENSQFDLYLFNVSLADEVGFELLEKVQNIDSVVPVVVCTADVRVSTRQRVMQAGAQVFFTKPIDYDALVETIAQLLPSHYLQ